MRAFQDLPIKRKLTLIILLTSTLALLLASAAFVVFERFTFKRDLVAKLATDAEMLAFNSASALSFDDADSATRTLQSLRVQPHTLTACIYDRDGNVFATYPANTTGFPPAISEPIARFGPNHLELFRPISEAGENLGTIYVRADLSALQDRMRNYALIVIAVLFVAILAAYAVASRLQRVISSPLSDLAAIAGRVAADKDYKVRATKRGDDEIGRLIDGFNEMLAQIQARDIALENAREGLERSVEERTAELQHQQARVQRIFDGVPVGISLTHVRDGVKTRILNHAQLRLSGLTRTQAEEPGIFAKLTHPEDRERQDLLNRQLAAGKIDRYSLEKRYVLPEGLVRWLVFSVERRYFPDGDYEDLSTAVDITALKHAQEETSRQQARFEFIFGAVPVGISWFVPDAVETHLVNPAHERITGVSAEDSRLPGAFARVSHPDDYRRQQELAAQFTSGKIDHYSLEKRYLHPGGRTVWAILTSRMFIDPATGKKQSVTTLVDITSLKEAQEKASREQARFKRIFDAVPVGFMWMVHGDVSTRIVNPAHERITGVPAAQCREIGRYREATLPEDRDRQDPLHDQLLAGEIDHYELEKRYVHPDGSVHWVEFAVRRYQDGASGETHELNTVIDITERKRAQRQLAEASGLLDAMLENTPDMIYFKDRESRFVRFSNALLRRFNLTDPAQMCGQSDFDLFGAEHAQQAFDDEQRIIRTGHPIISQLERENYADGRITWALTTKMPWRDGKGEIVGIIGISKDVTALKEAETRLEQENALLQLLMDNVPGTIYFKDTESRFVRLSRSKVEKSLHILRDAHRRDHPEAAEQLPPHLEGIEQMSAWLRGKTDFDVFDGERARTAYEEEQEIIRTGRAVINRVEHAILPNGAVIWHLVTKMPWRNLDGKVVGTFGLSQDITPMKEAEAKLEETHKELMTTSRQAGMAEVATGVLHNVGNVLNSVNVSATLVADHVRHSKAGNITKLAALFEQNKTKLADFLTKDPRGQMIPTYLGTLAESLAAEQKATIAEIEDLRRNIEHIKDIVAMQQAYARTSGVIETISLPEMVEDALRINAGSLARHDVDLVRDYRARGVITTDKHKVIQILINLVRNAKYACDETGRTDKRIIVRTSSDERGIKISVTDNGVGIPPENLLRIFNHGFTTRKEGHGFGLHSGALAAKELGGALVVDSEGAGKGATFTLELPHKV